MIFIYFIIIANFFCQYNENEVKLSFLTKFFRGPASRRAAYADENKEGTCRRVLFRPVFLKRKNRKITF